MNRSGYSDLPLHGGRVPKWLAERMAKLGGAICEAIVLDYGRSGLMSRLSDPFWFQSFGCVLGMDWHSSGITTSVMGALKRSLQPMQKDLGIYVCGGRGKHSRKTPDELLKVAEKTGLNGNELVRCSKLSAKIDNTAVQDGFQLYLHSFIVTESGEWVVVQQGMHNNNGMARRYHWHSANVDSFVNDPHTAVCGVNQGKILNLVHSEAADTRNAILEVGRENTTAIMKEARMLLMPRHHDVRAKDVDLKRLGSVLATAQDSELRDFESLLLLKGLGPRTLQSLTLVSEVIHGTASRFSDPARFSFAHGGKDGHPFAVPTFTYDEVIDTLSNAINKAKIDLSEKSKAIERLTKASQRNEKGFTSKESGFEDLVNHERRTSYTRGGKTVFGDSQPPIDKPETGQMSLF